MIGGLSDWRAVSGRDVLVLFHAVDSEQSMAMTPYYRRLARRFAELDIPGVVVARFDVSTELPPPQVALQWMSSPAPLPHGSCLTLVNLRSNSLECQ